MSLNCPPLASKLLRRGAMHDCLMTLHVTGILM